MEILSPLERSERLFPIPKTLKLYQLRWFALVFYRNATPIDHTKIIFSGAQTDIFPKHFLTQPYDVVETARDPVSSHPDSQKWDKTEKLETMKTTVREEVARTKGKRLSCNENE